MSLYDNTSTHPYTAYFSSDNRISGSNASFVSPVVDLGLNDYNSVCIMSAQIPRSFFNCPTAKNTFTVIQNGISTVCTLVPGSYNKINLRSQLQTRLNAIADSGRVYTVTYPAASEADTFRYTFTFAGGTGNVSFVFSNNSLTQQLGFINGTFTFAGGSLTSINCINLSFINKCFIQSNIIDESDSLLEILNYGSYPMLSMCYFEQQVTDLNTKLFSFTNTNSWLFSLVDGNGDLIDLNGIPWSFVIVFYRRSDTHQLHRNELLMVNEERLQRIADEQNKLKLKLLKDEEIKKEPDEKKNEEINFDSTVENFSTNNIQSSNTDGDVNVISATYPVLPYYSSSSLTNIL